jgi:hypothetical protein
MRTHLVKPRPSPVRLDRKHLERGSLLDEPSAHGRDIGRVGPQHEDIRAQLGERVDSNVVGERTNDTHVGLLGNELRHDVSKDARHPGHQNADVLHWQPPSREINCPAYGRTPPREMDRPA